MFSNPPEETEKVFSVIVTDLFFGRQTILKLKAAALLVMAPKLLVS